MRSVQKPKIKTISHFGKCVSSTRDVAKKTRLLACKNAIKLATKNYDLAGCKQSFYTILKAQNMPASDDDLSGLYKSAMVRKNSPGRPIYDALFQAAPNGICPFCSQRAVKNLDHYLPKQKFPEFSVFPLNLVPSCSDCNKDKAEHFAQRAEEQLIHPYYDDLPNEKWLFGEVLYVENDPVIKFNAKPPSNWDQLLCKRVYYHFSKLELGKLYSTHAGSELTDIKRHHYELFSVGGVYTVKSHLEQIAASRAAANLNSWQTAMYQALLESSKYCAGSFGFVS